MTTALATSWIDSAYPRIPSAAERWVQAARTLDARACFAQRLPVRPRATGRALRAGGVSVVGLAVPFEQLGSLVAQSEGAAGLRASYVVVEGGPGGENREAATDALVRALYPLHASGVPLALRNGEDGDALLGLQEISWMLDELSGLGLVFDAARAQRCVREAAGVDLNAWLDAFASRTVAVVATGMGPEGTGRCHPEDGPLDWSTLRARVSRQAPWIFDPREDLGEDEVLDALRALRGLRA